MIDWSFLKPSLERIAVALEGKPTNVADQLLERGLEQHALNYVKNKPWLDHEAWKQARFYRVAELAGAALTVDGEHHKQWFLERIIEACGLDPSMADHEPGIAP